MEDYEEADKSSDEELPYLATGSKVFDGEVLLYLRHASGKAPVPELGGKKYELRRFEELVRSYNIHAL